MHSFRFAFACLTALLFAAIAFGQSTEGTMAPQPGGPFGPKAPSMSAPPPLAQPNTEGATLLQQSLAAIGAETPAADVTLAGKITVFIPGGTTDTGTITMAARGDSQAEIVMAMATGIRTEVRTVSSDGLPAEMRTGPDGAVTHNPVHSLLTPHPAWFFPQFVLSAHPVSTLLSSFIASETRNGVPVNHLEVWQSPPNGSSLSTLATQQQTQYDLYLDPATSLPLAMVYYVQPDYRQLPPVIHRDTRAPVEMQFSNYQRVQGTAVALHIQAFIQGRQIYDIQLSTVTFDSNPSIPTVN